MNTVFCSKLKIQAEALNRAPYPGDIGKRILAEISKPAWAEWLKHQTMLINENRLSPLEPKARAYLVEQMQLYLFSDNAEAPAGFTPPAA